MLWKERSLSCPIALNARMDLTLNWTKWKKATWSPAMSAERSTRWWAWNLWSWRGWTAIWMWTTNRWKRTRRTSEAEPHEFAGRGGVRCPGGGGGSRGVAG